MVVRGKMGMDGEGGCEEGRADMIGENIDSCNIGSKGYNDNRNSIIKMGNGSFNNQKYPFYDENTQISLKNSLVLLYYLSY